MKKKSLVIIMTCCLLASLLAGCGNKNRNDTEGQSSEATEESTQSETETESGSGTMGTGVEDFQNLLTTTSNSEDIYQFMDQNMDQYESQDVDTVVTGIIGFHDDISEVDFERIAKHTDVMSDETREFVELMVTEQQTPSIDQGEIQITLTDLLNRCRILEDHITKYADGVTYRYAYEQYQKMLTQAIQGGYDGEDTSTHFYADEENSQSIDDLAVDAYQAFIEDNPDSITTQILEEYVDTLSNNDNNINNNVNDYYNSLGESIQTRFNS